MARVVAPGDPSCRRWQVVLIGIAMLVAGCRRGPSTRAGQVLAMLAPSATLGVSLGDALPSSPGGAVLPRGVTIGDPRRFRPIADTAHSVELSAIIPSSSFDGGENASDSAVVSGLVFATTPRVADSLAARVTELFQKGAAETCARIASAGRDTVLVWDAHGRGGVAISFPEHGATSLAPSPSYVIVYAGEWEPARLLRDYAPAPCSEAAHVIE